MNKKELAEGISLFVAAIAYLVCIAVIVSKYGLAEGAIVMLVVWLLIDIRNNGLNRNDQ